MKIIFSARQEDKEPMFGFLPWVKKRKQQCKMSWKLSPFRKSHVNVTRFTSSQPTESKSILRTNLQENISILNNIRIIQLLYINTDKSPNKATNNRSQWLFWKKSPYSKMVQFKI